MIAASILVAAALIYWGLRRVTMAVLFFGHVIEQALNRAAAQRGDPPVTTPGDAEHFR